MIVQDLLTCYLTQADISDIYPHTLLEKSALDFDLLVHNGSVPTTAK